MQINENNSKGITLVAIVAIMLVGGATVSLTPMNVVASSGGSSGDTIPALIRSNVIEKDGEVMHDKKIEANERSSNAAVENERTFKQSDAGSAAPIPAYEGQITFKDSGGEVFKEIEVQSADSSSTAEKKQSHGMEQEIEDVSRGGEAE